MTACVWLTRRQLRRRGWTLLPVMLVVLLGGTGALLALEASDRTATAYRRYLDHARIGDVEINPSFASAEIDKVIRELPGVEQATTSTLLWAAVADGGAPVRYSEMSAEETVEAVFGSTDGRYDAMDRLAYDQGRAPTGRSEAVVSTEMARQRGFEVGDTVSVSFWNVHDDVRDLYPGEDPWLEPLGVEQLTIVGVVTFPNEVLPDELYPRGRMVVSPDIAARYDCWLHEPPLDASLEDILEMLDGCTVLHRYWSLAVGGGKREAEAVQDAFIRASSQRNANLPDAMVELDARYILISTTTDAEAQRVERSVQPTVAGLRILAMAAALCTVVLSGLVIARALRSYRDDQVHWWHLGLGVGARTTVTVVPLLSALVMGSVGAVTLAWLLSGLGPVGNVRAIEPSPGRGLGMRVLLLGVATLVLLGLTAVLRGWRAARTAPRAVDTRRPAALSPSLVARTSAPTTVGLRAAWGTGRGAGLLIGGGGIATASVVAALVFGASLSTLLATPRWLGWPWDAVVLEGFGYGGVGPEEVAEVLHDEKAVEAWAGLGSWQSITVNGVAIPSLVTYDGASEVDLALVGGRLPLDEDEVALGSLFARQNDIRVGDEVTLEGDGLAVDRAQVTGLVVLPAVGPFQSDRLSPGYGMLVPQRALEPKLASRLLSYIGLSLVDGADAEEVLADVEDGLRAMDPDSVSLTYSEPVAPPELVEARTLRVVPAAVAGLVAVGAVVALATALVASVRTRRAELAVLQALGFTDRQVRRSIQVQACATVLAALALGVPLGVTAGQHAWRRFAAELGVVPTPSAPPVVLIVTLVASLGAAVLAAFNAGRLATRISLTDALRNE